MKRDWGAVCAWSLGGLRRLKYQKHIRDVSKRIRLVDNSSGLHVPEAQLKLARRFNAGYVVEFRMSPEGTADSDVRSLSIVPSRLVAPGELQSGVKTPG